jgi:antitoxin component HigA of HigAB toxin-antitoxin module
MTLPGLIDAVEFRRDSYGLTQGEWAFVLGIQPSHYSEFVNSKRALPIGAMAKCFEYGVPAECLFQCLPNKTIRHIKAKLKEKNT